MHAFLQQTFITDLFLFTRSEPKLHINLNETPPVSFPKALGGDERVGGRGEGTRGKDGAWSYVDLCRFWAMTGQKRRYEDMF